MSPAFRARAAAATVDPLAYAQQQEAARQADIKARAESARLLAEQRSESDAAKRKAQAEADRLKRESNFSALTTRTNAEWNQLMSKQAEKNKPQPIRVTTKDDKGGSITRMLSPSEFAAEKKAKDLADLTAKRDLLKSSWFIPETRGIPAKIADVEKQISALNTPSDLVSAPVQSEVAPLIQSQGGSMFSGATSATGPGIAPVRGSGFIGTPGGPNRFIDPTGRVDAPANPPQWGEPSAAPRDLLGGNGFRPVMGDLRQAEGNATVIQDPAPAPLTAASSGAPPIPESHIRHLLENPDLADFFNKKYGAGEAEKLLQVDRQP